jgi:2-polyprenyl-6-hydroxyphenyl methylase/3-demethylubiquinone-9 3-methyltransferase
MRSFGPIPCSWKSYIEHGSSEKTSITTLITDELNMKERIMQTHQSTIDPAEVAKFEAMAAEWWDPNGKFKPLHMLNPCRLDYITSQIAAEFGRDLSDSKPFAGLRLLDIGCGGGLLSEPMARLGATVVGADAAAGNLPVARLHAEQSGLEIDYRHTTAEDLAAAGEQFDAVLNMEVVEHVADPQTYLNACQTLLKTGGMMICSTINRNPKSYIVAILGAEVVMRWLPRGTHEWDKFITPDELFDLISKAGLSPVDRKGFVFNPILWTWSLSDRDLSVNYVTASIKPV